MILFPEWLRERRQPRLAVPDSAARAIANMAHARFSDGRGGTVFLAGGRGAGHRLVFDRLAHLLDMGGEAPLLLRGSIVNGTYVPAVGYGEPGAGALSAAADLTVRLAPLAGPLGPLLGQIVGSVNDLQRIKSEIARNAISSLSGPQLEPRLLQRTLRILADSRPVCLAIEGLAPGVPHWWMSAIDSLSTEAEVDLPLITIVAFEGPSVLAGEDENESQLLRLARTLVNSGRAVWQPIPCLDEASLARLIGASSPEVLRELNALTKGQAGWAADLFTDLRRRGVVVKDRRRRWVFDHTMLGKGIAPINYVMEDCIRETLEGDVRLFEEAKRILALAALQGETFMLAPIAELLGMSVEACKRVVDRLTRGEQPLLERASVLLEPPARTDDSHHRYRFTEQLIWHALTRYGLSERERRTAALECAQSLERLYALDRAPIAGTLELLYAFAENVNESRRWQRVAGQTVERDHLRWQAKALLHEESRWADWTREEAQRASGFLLHVAIELSRIRPPHELFPLLEGAERLARLHDLRHDRSTAARFQGGIYTSLGDYDRARERLDTADRILGSQGSPNERVDLLCDLANLEKITGDVPQAIRRLDQAVELSQASSDASPGCLRVLARACELRGTVALGCGNVRSARPDLAKAVDLFREADDPSGLSSSLSSLGAAQIAGNDIAGAVESLREAVAICQSAGNKAGELAAQKHLGAVTRDKERAYRHHQRALVLARELNDAPVEAESLLELARCVHALCRWDEARCLLQECFELQLRLKDSVGVAWCVLEIGVLQIHVGALPQGEKNVKEALKRFSAGGSDEGLAATHHALGKLAARRGDRRTAQREFANADRIAGPVSNGGDFIVAPSTRPRRMWHPTG